MKEEKSLDLSSCGYDIIVLALATPTPVQGLAS